MACQTNRKRKYQQRPGAVAVAANLGVTYSHWRRVLAGERRSRSLVAKFESLKTGAIDPAAFNVSWEWNEDMGKIGFAVAFIRAPYSPALWENSGFEKRLGGELTEAGLGHLDSEKWGNPVTFFFYLHSKSLAAGLQLIKSRLSAIGLLQHVRIGYADAGDKCWRTFYPALERASA
jgi:hypothetical protein